MSWQSRLYAEFIEGRIPRALDLPTGLGKTSIIVIWLIAFAQGGPARGLPRRLVYVVDRRVVVDQASEEAQRISRHLLASDPIANHLRERLGIAGAGLAVSTLRGGRAEDREWTYDPGAPAIIVGTVDLIGSRLLFSGYRLSRWSRPLQAGLLGVDSLIVLDEAHLSPAFDAATRRVCALRHQATPAPIPGLRLLPLSATPSGAREDDVFCLTDADYEDATVRRRIGRERPTKRLTIEPLDDTKNGLADALATRAAEHDGTKRAVLVYCHSRETAKKTAERLRTLLNKQRGADIELVIGARRGRERDELTTKPTYRAFGPPPEMPAADATAPAERGWPVDGRTRYLVCTAAGEVGADLDAQAAVMDLVPLERMVQRFGRVNRRGNATEPAPITILFAPDELTAAADDKEDKKAKAARLAATKNGLERHLEELDETGGFDGSPQRIGRMLRELGEEGREAAFTVPPKIPTVERDHVEAWSLTSLMNHPGRPEVDPFLRGDVDEEPQTTVVWRVDVPYLAKLPESTIERALDAVPLRPPELLEAVARDAAEMLQKRIAAIRKDWQGAEEAGTLSGEPRCAMLLRRRDGVTVGWILRDSFLLGHERLSEKDGRQLTDRLSGAILLLEPGIGGLDEDGALGDVGALTTGGEAQSEYLRWERMHAEPDILIRLVPGSSGSEGGQVHIKPLAIPARLRESDPVIQTKAVQDQQLRGYRRVWWTRLPPTSVDEDGEGDVLEYWSARWDIDGETSAAKRAQLLDAHHRCAGIEMRRIATRLGLDDDLSDCLVTAIELHDFGKARERWQRAVRAPRDGVYAKTTSRGTGDLGGYRHEFGSLRDALNPERHHDRIQRLDKPFRELVLHLIAAHHGRARPFIPAIDEDERDVFGIILPETAFEAARRYVRLQREWGPWGLAWLEALLRAADATVSRQLDNPDPSTAGALE
jgi:CRISPR-associated endonuclease/helicase Cas3